jgi:tRNA dimethylallyltransferase
VVILGPTASGKSDVAMAAASQVNGAQILAVDAMQVYRGMDIGTAKPTAIDQQGVAHHGIDLVEPSATFTVSDYQAHATATFDQVRSQGGTTILVAGTGLYLTTVIDELTLPGEWPEIRLALADRSPQSLFVELSNLDPLAASRIDPANHRRLSRAVEVCLGSGRPFSSFGPGTGAYPPISTPQIGILWQREALTRRIETRVHQMIDRGLVQEVESLLNRSDPLSRTAAQALGYKEIIAALQGNCSIEESIATTMLRTRQFAVRQERWFRRDPRIRWIEVFEDPVSEVLPTVLELF